MSGQDKPATLISTTNTILAGYCIMCIVTLIASYGLTLHHAKVHMIQVIRRCRFIAHTADLSASCLGFHHISPTLFIRIIVIPYYLHSVSYPNIPLHE